jgi:putative hydrolase of HD superfamily
LLHNLHGDGHSWKENNVPKEKVFDLNSRIAKGSEDIWTVLKGKLEEAANRGLFNA